MEKPLMKCGHVANATARRGYVSYQFACAICDCVELSEEQPVLRGRTARCGCGVERPSSFDLAFFEFCGPGSPSATNVCKNCGYTQTAHESDNHARRRGKVCQSFTPRGDIGYDIYYCGCRGWD